MTTRQNLVGTAQRRVDGRAKVTFDNRVVSAVSVTLVNGSTRYRCGRRTDLACSGRPLDDNARFAVLGRATKR